MEGDRDRDRDMERINTLVVNLDDYRANFYKQKPHLEAVGLEPIRWSGINALKNEHLKHKKHISTMAQYFTPKSCIGCGLSHILLANWLNDIIFEKKYIVNIIDQDGYFLFMEDDAYPVEKFNSPEAFKRELWKTINDIELLDPSWDIIQLHRDGPIVSDKTYHAHYFCSSTAAYLLSPKGIRKLAREKVSNHIDLTTQNPIRYNKYSSRENLFYTDEKSSLNRGSIRGLNSISLLAKKTLLDKFTNIALRGEKDWGHILGFNFLRIPVLDKNITLSNFFDMVLFLTLAKSIKNITYNSI